MPNPPPASWTEIAGTEITGTDITATSNEPLPLNRVDLVWLVIEGPVEIFALRKDTESTPPRRIYLATAHAGDILFGWEDADRAGFPSLLAVGHSGATVRVVARRDLEAAWSQAPIRDALIAATDGWIEGMSNGLARYGRPAPAAEHTALAGDTFTLQAGQRAKARTGVIWVGADGGEVQIRDNTTITLGGENAAFPIAAENWLRAPDTVELAAADTAAVLQAGQLWQGVQTFHSGIFASLGIDLDAAQAEDFARMRQKSQANRTVLDASLAKVAGVMDPATGLEVSRDSQAEGALAEAAAIVAAYFGVQFQMPKTFVGEVTETDKLFQIARASGLRLRPVTLAKDWWRRSGQAMIAFDAEDGTACALVPEGRNEYRLHRPAERSSGVVDGQTADRLRPNAFAVYGRLPNRALRLSDLVTATARFVKLDMVQYVVLLGLSTLLSLLVPIVVGELMGTAIPFGELPRIAILAGLLAAAAIGQLTFNVAKAVAMMRLETQAENYLQSGVLDRVLRLPVSFFRGFTVGDLTRRVMGISAISQSVTGTVVGAVFSGVFGLANLVLMYIYSPVLSIAGTLLLFVLLIIVIGGNYLQNRIQKRALHLDGQVSGLVMQLLVGIAKIRIANAEPRAFGEWASTYADQRRETFKARSIANGLTIFYAMYTAFSSLLFFYLISFVLAEPIPLASFLAFSVAYGQVLAATMAMAGAVTGSMVTLALYDRMKPIFEAVPEIDEAREHPGVLGGAIEVSHASFGYAPDIPDAVKDVSIEVMPGEFVALVGGSGAGKSTLLRLILGFETPRSGAVFFDGKDLAKIDVSVVRQQLGVVMQNGGLTPSSILENIVGSSPPDPRRCLGSSTERGYGGRHPGYADGPADDRLGGRRQPVRRAAATPDDRPRPGQQTTDPAVRRGDQRARQRHPGHRHRKPGPAKADPPGRRAPPQHHREGGQDLRHA